MDPTLSNQNNSLVFLQEFTKDPVFKSESANKLSKQEKFAHIYDMLTKLDENLDFVVSSSKHFESVPKKLNKVFRLVGDEIKQDEVIGHQLALKCHSMLCKIITIDPSVIKYDEIPRVIAEAHYDQLASTADFGIEKKIVELEPPSKLDLYKLAGTDKATNVEDDFIRLVSELTYPVKENSHELLDIYETLSIAAQKNYPRLAVTCLNKLTTSQIMTFLSLTYGPEKQAVKQLVIENLKEIKNEDHPYRYERIREKIMKFIDTDLKTDKPWDEYIVRIAEDILDVAIALGSKEIIEKIYDKLASVDYKDENTLKKLCTSEQFVPFANQFAMYYTLTKNMFPENYTDANRTLLLMINNILKLRKEPHDINARIQAKDPRFLKQLVQSIVDLEDWKTPGKEVIKKPQIEIVDGVDSLTMDDIKTMALLKPSNFFITEVLLDKLGKSSILSTRVASAKKKIYELTGTRVGIY